MAKTLRDLENEKRQREEEIYAKTEESYKNFMRNTVNIGTCYGDVLIKCKTDNYPKTIEERDGLKNLLEEVWHIENRSELLNKLGYEILVVFVNDSENLPTVPMHLTSTGEAAKEADKILQLRLDSNQTIRSASRIVSGNSNVCN